jgi:hypothetical protein
VPDQFDFAVIHTVMPMSAPMPKIQMNRPSETGPSEPRLKPPADSFSCRYSSDEMMSRFSSG